jgi:uncharacterized protein DUF6378
VSRSILEEAAEVLADRRARVDGPKGNFARIAKAWSIVFEHEVTPRQVALCMIGLKFCRECHEHWRDNLVDLAGYADCAAVVSGDYDAEPNTKDEPENNSTSTINFPATPATSRPGWPYAASPTCLDVERHRDRGPGAEHHRLGNSPCDYRIPY